METSVNNKCRAFTSLEQSKKLAEILPLESADMVYQSIEDEYYDGEWESIHRNHSLNIGYDDDVPCWSLASLLGVLPEGYSFVLTKSFNGKDYYCKLDGKPIETMADNPVDACYELILKLKELNLL